MSTNPLAMWDFRTGQDTMTKEQIQSLLKKYCKKWVFQLEQGENTGYIHFQGRISLIKKHRKNEILKFFQPNYLEPTVNPNYFKGDMFYVMKDETRIDGPWDERETERYIPRHFRGKLEKLYPFQKTIFDSANDFDDRIINMIYCKDGNKGKSTVASLTELYANGIDLPPVNEAEKLIQSCCDICESKNLRNPSPIFVDLPRAMNKDRLNGIYTAIEQIKKGKLFDLRYKYKEWWIDSPTIWVFSNIEPDIDMLSKDRWKIWIINDKLELEKYTGELFNKEINYLKKY